MTKNNDLFQKPISLTASNLPASVIIGGQVRHRFVGKDNSIVFQVGPDTLSINVINYSGFNNFKARISRILGTALDSLKIDSLQQIRLRYINRFPKTRNLQDIFNIQYPILKNKNDISKIKGLQISSTEEENEKIYILTNIVHSIEKDAILDISGFYTSEMSKVQWNLDLIMDWTDNTHNIIYKHFDSLVTNQEKERRK